MILSQIAAALIVFAALDTSYQAPRSCQKEPILMLSAQWCPYCKLARKFFQQNDIDYIEYDIDKPIASADRKKFMDENSVPQIRVGFALTDGFVESRLRSMLCLPLKLV